MKRVKGVLITAAFTLGLLAAALWAWNHHGWWLARHWASQLEQAPEDRLDGLLDCIVRLGEPGIPALIDALASAKPELAERASVALDDEIERWKTLPAAAAAPRLKALSRGLASRVEQFGPQTQQRAAAIAQRILVWPTDTAPGGTEVVRSCETVLRSVSARAGTTEGSGTASHGTPEGSNKDGLRVCETVLQMDRPMLRAPRHRPPRPPRRLGSSQGFQEQTGRATSPAQRASRGHLGHRPRVGRPDACPREVYLRARKKVAKGQARAAHPWPTGRPKSPRWEAPPPRIRP